MNGHMATWPEFPLHAAIKEVIERVFHLIDGETKEAGRVFSELFVPDGEVVFSASVDKGRQGE